MGNIRTILGCILLVGCATTTPPWEQSEEEAANAPAPDVAASAENEAEDAEDVTWEEGFLPEDSGEKQTDGDVSDSVEASANSDDGGDPAPVSDPNPESESDRAAREAAEAAARSALRDVVKDWSARGRAAEGGDDENYAQLRRTYESYLESVVANESSLRLRLQVSLLARNLTKPHAERNLAHAMLRRFTAALQNDKTPVAGRDPARIEADAEAALQANADKRAAARRAFHKDFDRDLKKSMLWEDARRRISLFRQK